MVGVNNPCTHRPPQNLLVVAHRFLAMRPLLFARAAFRMLLGNAWTVEGDLVRAFRRLAHVEGTRLIPVGWLMLIGSIGSCYFVSVGCLLLAGCTAGSCTLSSGFPLFVQLIMMPQYTRSGTLWLRISPRQSINQPTGVLAQCLGARSKTSRFIIYIYCLFTQVKYLIFQEESNQ